MTDMITPEPDTLLETYKDKERRSTIEKASVKLSVDATEEEDTNVPATSRKSPLQAKRLKRFSEANNKHRRTSILGNLLTEGRNSHAYSYTHLSHHLTESQRNLQGTDGGIELPPEDYYLMEELDSLGIFLEKPDKIPGGVASLLLSEPPSKIVTEEAVEEGQQEPPENAVFPVARNTVELTNKLAVIRSLRSYQKNYRMMEKKCYYGEDEVDLSFLTSKPASFIILGKPGIGKTTLAIKMAERLHSVHLNPENIIEYFHRSGTEPLSSIKVNEILDNGESLGDAVVVELLRKRIREFDVLHRGYVLEGFPVVTSEDLSAEEQLRNMENLAIPPEYVIIMQMQDKDLYKRRIKQKFDPGTGRVFSEQQYSKRDPDDSILNRKKVESGLRDLGGGRIFGGDEMSSENPVTEEASDTDRKTTPPEGFDISTAESLSDTDFPRLPPEILDRLFCRTEDVNVIVNDDLESFRYNFADLQKLVEEFDKRKVLEVDAYWSPSIIFKRVWEFIEAIGLQPVPIPIQIMKSFPHLFYKKRSGEEPGENEDQEDESEDDESDDDEVDDDQDGKSKTDNTSDPICEEEPPPEIDWEAAIRAICVKGLVDPRFRWRISRWWNICPVSLKQGRSTPGKPELAVSFMDKVFFLTSKQAVEQFTINPRPYLLPKMPTSPIKFIVIGHPLSGKTTFAKELAALTESNVIDVSREITKRFLIVKRDHMWKKRLRFALEATHTVNMENALRWQKQERTRRRDMHAWIENYLRELAEAELLAALERDREMMHRLRIELRKQLEYHAMGEPYAGDGFCQLADGTMHFNWKRFALEAFGGKKEWTHQELLELAWDLFRQRRLYYKRLKREAVLKAINDFDDSNSEEELGLSPTSFSGETSEEEETSGEEEEMITKIKRKKKKKKHKCVQLQIKPVVSEEIVEPFLFDTFDVDPDDPEVEESVRMKFPMIPFELVDIVPSPPLVGDVDPVVQMIVDEKLAKESAYLDTLPPEIFVEILRCAIEKNEAGYRRRHRHGTLTGGWIIDNFPPDIDKWRAVLRTPQVCPDQVFLMLDLTEGNITVWNRFKKLYKILNPKPLGSAEHPNSPGSSYEPILGEDGLPTGEFKKKKKHLLHGIPGEDVSGFDSGEQVDEVFLSVHAASGSPRSAGSSRSRSRKDGDNISQISDVDKSNLEVVSKSHFIRSLLPQDDLSDVASMTHSEAAMIERDLHRIQTAVFSDATDDSEYNSDFAESIDGRQKKYIFDPTGRGIELLGEGGEADGDGLESYDSDDYDDVEKRKEAATKLKPLYGEMTACLRDEQEGDGAADVTPAQDKKSSIKNPPGTPETGDEDDAVVEIKTNWQVAERLNNVNSADKKSVSSERSTARGNDDEDVIPTPPEMQSEAGISPRTIVGDNDAVNDEKEAIYQKLLTNKIESPKRKFFGQIRLFNEFWNMALPVCNQQQVKTWEVGLCNVNTALEKSLYFWNQLESRFEVKAKKILETDLREEDEEIMASLMKWGEPYETGDFRYRPVARAEEDEESEPDSEFDDDETDDDLYGNRSESSSCRGKHRGERDELANLENKPNLYWKALGRQEAERCFGDFKYFCPVSYADYNLVRKGFSKYCCKYKDRLYYCASEHSQLRFLTNPKQFLPIGGPPTPPPPRICISGSPGCLQEEIASALATEHKVCYVNFRQKLHEIIKARLGKPVGPDQTGVIVSVGDSVNIIEQSSPTDDLLTPPHSVLKSSSKLQVPSDEEEDVHSKRSHVIFKTTSSKKLNIPNQEIEGEIEQVLIQEATLKSLGLLTSHVIETIPLNSIDRTERMTERKWEKLTWAEAHIQAFLENGIQLPDEVLDEFIRPLWKEAPFTNVGFVLVGFPNTVEDVEYMIKNNLIPEHVFVMECKSIVVRNRLIIPAVDRWHFERNPSGLRTKRLSSRTQRVKNQLELAALGMINEDSEEIFPYQTEGRHNVDEYETETWSYNDALSRDISRSLKYFHQIYSGGIEKMKKMLNKERFSWTPIDTNIGIFQGKHRVMESAGSMLKHRNNLFEDTVRLSFHSAHALLERGVFTLSTLERWCPVEISKGNTGINVWNSPEIQKIAYLHRRFIYFVAGEKNAKQFEANTFELINQVVPLQPVPLACMILGKAKTGKTTLARSLADKFGLLYVTCLEAVQSVIYHAFVTEWAHLLNEINPAIVSSGGHQPMLLANEILEYIRQGRTIPRFLVYRCLDLFLMNPKYIAAKAQCNGVIFDDFPNIIDELIELNYREMTPSIVIHLRIPITEAYRRCDASRPPELTNDQQVPEESNECIDYLWDLYQEATKETIQWFTMEYQNICRIDGTQNPMMILNQASEICIKGQSKILDYMENVYLGKPNTLEGTCPITSSLFKRLNTEYGFFCPVALNDSDELISVREITDLSQIVEFNGKIYLFSGKHAVKKFMANPRRYTNVSIIRTPPKDIPQTIMVSPEDWERMREHWGFMDFDPVLYYANHHYKGLQRGDPKYCVVYRRKLYVFITEDNQKKFLRKPTQYWNLLLPMKIPRKAEPIDYDKITPFSYLSAKGMISVLRKVVKLMAEKRPRAPFMNVDQCAALYMGYFLKTQNMNAPYERRQRYRNAMFNLSTMQTSTRDFLTELNNFYGCRQRNLPERLKKRFDEFVKFEYLPVEQKVFMPKIPGLTLSYDAVPAPYTVHEATRKVIRMMEKMKQVDMKDKMEAFSAYSKRKKAAEDAAERAAQDAKDAAEAAKKMMERSQIRVKARSQFAGQSSNNESSFQP